jgi:hypothetical protein
MTTVTRSTAIAASADRCWDALRDFGAIDKRLAVGFIIKTQLISNDVREVSLANGVVLKERLVGLDDDAMRLAYTVIDDQVGITHHNGSVQIIPGADSAHCTILWITDILPDGLSDLVGALMDSALPAIKQTLEGEVRHSA